MQVERRIGGAGTGKTAFVLDQMDRVCDEQKLVPGEIAFATFAKSGCIEMSERAGARWGLARDALPNFRTVHSLAYRALKVAQDEFLGDDSASLAWIGNQIGIDLAADVDDSGNTAYRPLNADDTDEVASLAIWNLARVTLRPVEELLTERLQAGERVPPADTIKYIVDRYESAKTIHGRRDYCDIVLAFAGIRMTLDGPRSCEPAGEAPEGLRAVFVDECQDNSALIDRAIMRLARTPGVGYVLLVGDPMQSIFESFAGASAKHFMGWQARESVMPKSFRCPAPILALGERCLREMDSGYWDRGITPADHSGRITQAGAPLDAIEEHLDLSKQTLILARCGYALQAYEEIFDDLGIPYSRETRHGDPDRQGFQAMWDLQSGKSTSGDAWQHAIDMIPVKHPHFGDLLVDGEKSAWLTGRRYDLDIFRPADLERAGCTPVLAAMICRGEWVQVLSPSKQEKARRWIDHARRHGAELATHPPVRLATIHSAKGLEADTVLLSTHSSRRVERGRDSSLLRHDEECRVNYVAVTRARSKLVIVEDGCRQRLVLPL